MSLYLRNKNIFSKLAKGCHQIPVLMKYIPNPAVLTHARLFEDIISLYYIKYINLKLNIEMNKIS